MKPQLVNEQTEVLDQIQTLVELCRTEREAVTEVRNSIVALERIRKRIRDWLLGKRRKDTTRMPWSVYFVER